MFSKPTLVALVLGFVCLQAVQPIYSQTVAPYSSPVSPSMFYDNDGHSVLSSTYPYYSYFDYHAPNSLAQDYDMNRNLALYSGMYNVPMSDMYQLYGLIENNMPGIPRNNELDMLEGFASSIQNERVRDLVNPYQYRLSYGNNLSMNDLMGYLPSDMPPSMAYMTNYVDSMVPSLSPDTMAEIQSAVYTNTPHQYAGRADDLTFQSQTAIRYMMANDMYFTPNY